MPATINSDDGVVSGSAGLKTTGANDGILALQNNGTTNVTVTAAGNVGVGTTTPPQKFTVNGASATTGSNACFVTYDRTTSAISNTIYSPIAGQFRIYDNVAAVDRVIVGTDGAFQFNSGYGSVATAYGCRAWVNFNGTGTVAIRASGNVSSISDLGVGSYTINFSTAMPDANYSWSAAGNDTVNGVGATNSTPTYKTSSAVMIAGSMGLETFFNSRPTGTQYSNGNADCSIVTVTFFR
jgi:hypothetical protein